jgi:hypothetical protein
MHVVCAALAEPERDRARELISHRSASRPARTATRCQIADELPRTSSRPTTARDRRPLRRRRRHRPSAHLQRCPHRPRHVSPPQLLIFPHVYFQSVGTYRETPGGTKIYFTNRRIAALSQKYGEIFQTEREHAESHPVSLLSNTGYDLGTRGLSPGNVWMVQLLAHVPWIYNEAGGNSAGMVGLNPTDKHSYAAGLVAGVEHCIPPPP